MSRDLALKAVCTRSYMSSHYWDSGTAMELPADRAIKTQGCTITISAEKHVVTAGNETQLYNIYILYILLHKRILKARCTWYSQDLSWDAWGSCSAIYGLTACLMTTCSRHTCGIAEVPSSAIGNTVAVTTQQPLDAPTPAEMGK